MLHLSWTQVPPAENGPRHSLNATSNCSKPFAAAAAAALCVYFYPRIYCGKVFSLCTEILETAGSSEQTCMFAYMRNICSGARFC